MVESSTRQNNNDLEIVISLIKELEDPNKIQKIREYLHLTETPKTTIEEALRKDSFDKNILHKLKDILKEESVNDSDLRSKNTTEKKHSEKKYKEDLNDAIITQIKAEEKKSKCVVQEAIQIHQNKNTRIRNLFNDVVKNYDLYSTCESFCFVKNQIIEYYHKLIDDYSNLLNKKEDNLAKVKNDIKLSRNTRDVKELRRIEEELKKINKKLRKIYNKEYGISGEDYNSPEYSGYSITRHLDFPFLGKTNSIIKAKKIDIKTVGLDQKSAIRIALRSGEFLEIHLDERGNYNFENPPVLLTSRGAKKTSFFMEGNRNSEYIYNNYGQALKDLKKLKNLKVNGRDVLSNIMKNIEKQKKNSICVEKVIKSKKRDFIKNKNKYKSSLYKQREHSTTNTAHQYLSM